MTRFAAVLACVCLLAPALSAQSTPDVHRMEQIVQDSVTNGQFMGTVLVERDGTVLFDKAYGSADLEWKVPNAPDTRFRLGSITKQFTAASVLLLQEKGKLKIDEPISKHMPDAPPAWKNITFINLLNHTSGIPSFTSFPDYHDWQRNPTTPEQLVARFRDKPLDFQPGVKWNYSNSGYVLLGYLIEKIGGQPYCDFLAQNIFTPLAMKDSGCDRNSAILAQRAAGYTPGPNGLRNADYVDMTVPFSAGELYSTTGDLLRWQHGLFGGKLLSPASLEKMTTPGKENYGFGLAIETNNGHQRISHGGGINGFNTIEAWYPQEKLSIIVLANVNGDGQDRISQRIASLLHGEPVVLASERKEVPVPAATLDHYLGVYQLSPEFSITVTREGDHLLTQGSHQPTLPISASSQTRFFARAVDAEIEFFPNAAGNVDHLVLYQGGRETKGVKQPAH